MAATCMAVCKGSRKKIRGIFISSCHLPVAVECDIVILSEPGPIPQAPVGQFCRHNLSPRGDGNLRQIDFVVCNLRHNLSPRGDGNFRSGRHSCPPPTQLIPARGRKLPLKALKPLVDLDTTYPREGTETGLTSSGTPTPRDTTYPREGTETKRSPAGTASRSRHNLSPRGDGNS